MGVCIGIRELRDKLASYMESTVPIEVTRNGQTVGFYIPGPRRPGQAEREALLEAGRRLAGKRFFLGGAAARVRRHLAGKLSARRAT